MSGGTKDMVRAESHSKLILTGEHSVVYGYPAIAVPFPLKVYIDVWREQGEVKVITPDYTGELADTPMEWRGIAVVIEKIHEYINQPLQDIVIQMKSEIPQGRGLGSSAAIAMALVRGLFKFHKRELTNEILFHFVGLAETFAHGKPSGIDMMAVFSDAPIYFTKEEGAHSISCSIPFYLVVADSGMEGNTKSAVEQVRSRYEADKESVTAALKRMGTITSEIKEAMKHSDSKAIGSLMTENHSLLKELGVSSESLDNLVEAAIKAGALGAKLTGGGLGGCVIALVDSIEMARNVMNGFMEIEAKDSWYFSLESYEILESVHSIG